VPPLEPVVTPPPAPPPAPPVLDSCRYYVTFIDDCCVKSVRTVRCGTPVAMPACSVRYGCVFAGWYTESGCQWNFSQPVAANMTLYAKWVPSC
jgi:uncharacterized repeat protein (TIGR02543 family)